jgi:hypothetical protein
VTKRYKKRAETTRGTRTAKETDGDLLKFYSIADSDHNAKVVRMAGF